jgi:hypothetical protein
VSLAAIRRSLAPGQLYDVTNEAHPSNPFYGTHRRSIVSVNTVGFCLSHPDEPEGSHVGWPPASQIDVDGSGVIRLRTEPGGRVWLTLTPCDGAP